MLKPIDDLIECLKSGKPYGQNEALKLYEALKRINNAIIESENSIRALTGSGGIAFNSNQTSQGGGTAPRMGSVDQLIINPNNPTDNYDPGYYGVLAVREYMTIFDQVSGRQMLGFFVDKSTPNRHRILSTRFGTSKPFMPISFEIGNQLTNPAIYIHTDSKVAFGHIVPAEVIDVIGNILSSLNFMFKSGTAFIGTLDHGITAPRTWTLQDLTGTLYETGGLDVAIADGGTNLSALPANGQLLIGNAGVYVLATLTGTVKQVIVTNGAGTITLSLPQDIDTAAVIQFLRMGLGTPADATASLKTANKIWCGTDLQIDGDLDHNGTNIGFYGAAPVPRPAAYTQTYATATRTHLARTHDTITDSSGGTPGTTINAITGGGAACENATKDAVASLAKELNDTKVDTENTAQVLNQLILDLKSNGILQ